MSSKVLIITVRAARQAKATFRLHTQISKHIIMTPKQLQSSLLAEKFSARILPHNKHYAVAQCHLAGKGNCNFVEQFRKTSYRMQILHCRNVQFGVSAECRASTLRTSERHFRQNAIAKKGTRSPRFFGERKLKSEWIGIKSYSQVDRKEIVNSQSEF